MTNLPYMHEATTNLSAIDGVTLVGCVYCCSTYVGDENSFDTCVDNGVCETLICKRCDIDAVVPIVTGSQLFHLNDDETIQQLVAWRKLGFGF